ncbi:hypothetical protein LZ017_12945 [Pelomonas sp. CA6]|uniref:hypothetical protein n=1 Tax=Pelomonas sp. CA6 TaxID=2907999 RepID=UPI001F4BDA10|nr:hypothetical protein [Pelomonas sp. CA6]MCH7344284.1 hypothetical protein [Pelomonas sp. CA6]
MTPLDALWHFCNLFLPAWGVAALMALAVKLLWRRQSGAGSWASLWLWAGLGGSAGQVAGLALTGRDGSMNGYALMLLGLSVALWFRLGRR